MFKLDEYSSECRVIDQSNEIWHMQILNQKYKDIKEGQVVRIRQATLQNHKNYNRVFGLKSHSNISSLPSHCKLAQEMQVDEKNEQFNFEASILTQKSLLNAPLAHPIIISKNYDESLSQREFVTLKQLIYDAKDTVKCRFAVNQFVPETF